MCHLRREGAAAAAVPRRVGILKYKPLAHERLFVLKGGAVQIQETLGVDEEARAMLFENLVAVACLDVNAHGVREAGAAAALHADAQAANIRRHTFLFEQGADFLRGVLGQVNLRNIWTCDFSSHNQLSLQRNPAQCEAFSATGTSMPCFFFQSPMAALMASSASTEQ